MSVSLDKPRKGDVVANEHGSTGVVVDRAWGYTESAVLFDDSQTGMHIWIPDVELKVVGYRPNALVWFAARMVPAHMIRKDK